MIKRILAAFLACTLVVNLGCNAPADVDSIPKVMQPRNLVNRRFLESQLGRVLPGSKHSVDFQIINDHPHPVRISRIDSSCGCAVGSAPKGLFRPGEIMAITVEYRAGQSSVDDHRSLWVHFSPAEIAPVELKLLAAVRSDLAPTSRRLDLGRIAPGSTTKVRFQVLGFREELENFQVRVEELDAKFLVSQVPVAQVALPSGLRAVRPFAVWDVVMQLKASDRFEIDPKHHLLIGTATCGTATTNFQLPITYTMRRAVSAVPARVVQPNALAGSVVSGRILLNIEETTLAQFHTEQPDLTLTVAPDPLLHELVVDVERLESRFFRLNWSFTPSEPGLYKSTFKIYSGAGTDVICEIPFSALVTGT